MIKDAIKSAQDIFNKNTETTEEIRNLDNIYAVIITHKDDGMPSGTTIKVADGYDKAREYLIKSFGHSLKAITSGRFESMHVEYAEFIDDKDSAYISIINYLPDGGKQILDTRWEIFETCPTYADIPLGEVQQMVDDMNFKNKEYVESLPKINLNEVGQTYINANIINVTRDDDYMKSLKPLDLTDKILTEIESICNNNASAEILCHFRTAKGSIINFNVCSGGSFSSSRLKDDIGAFIDSCKSTNDNASSLELVAISIGNKLFVQ